MVLCPSRQRIPGQVASLFISHAPLGAWPTRRYMHSGHMSTMHVCTGAWPKRRRRAASSRPTSTGPNSLMTVPPIGVIFGAKKQIFGAKKQSVRKSRIAFLFPISTSVIGHPCPLVSLSLPCLLTRVRERAGTGGCSALLSCPTAQVRAPPSVLPCRVSHDKLPVRFPPSLILLTLFRSMQESWWRKCLSPSNAAYSCKASFLCP
jgi:hypothetical protein